MALAATIIDSSQGAKQHIATATAVVNDFALQAKSDNDDCLLAGLYYACLDVLTGLHAATKHSRSMNKSTSEVQDVGWQAKSSIDLTDILESFVLWGDVIVTGKAQATSIKFPTLYKDIARLLLSAGKVILKATQFVQHAARDRSVFSLESWIEKAIYMLSSSRCDVEENSTSKGHDDINTDGSDTSSNFTVSEGDEDHVGTAALEENMSLLMELLPSISSVATLDRPLKLRSVPSHTEFEVSLPASIWITRVADKYINAVPGLVKRLGEANWQRFCKLRIRSDADIAVEYTHAKSVFHDNSTAFRDSAMGTSLASRADDKRSVASHSSFLSSNVDESHHFNRVPTEPREVALGQPFTCPVCHSLLDKIRDRIDWKDLQPYICLFENCDQHLHTFATRKAWSEHDLQNHREKMFYQCFDCSTYVDTQTEFRNHLEKEHPTRNAAQASVLTSAAARRISQPNTWVCPLCQRQDFVSAKKFTTHVCAHMEDIALTALPRDMYENESESDESNSQTSRRPNPPKLTVEDNRVINARAAEMAKSSRGQLSRIVESMDPRVRQSLAEKNIDPIIYHFRMKATKEFRMLQAATDYQSKNGQTSQVGVGAIRQPAHPQQSQSHKSIDHPVQPTFSVTPVACDGFPNTGETIHRGNQWSQAPAYVTGTRVSLPPPTMPRFVSEKNEWDAQGLFEETSDQNLREKEHDAEMDPLAQSTAYANQHSKRIPPASPSAIPAHRSLTNSESLMQQTLEAEKAKIQNTKFQCATCDKYFTRAATLRSHQLVHAGQKPYECANCGRSFTRKNDCTRHEKMHMRRKSDV